MREFWLQLYIKEHYHELGFSKLEGPFEVGPDFRGVYKGQQVRVEAEMEYKGYLQHSSGWADVLIVGTFAPTPPECKEKLPSIVITVDPQKVLEWSAPLRQAYRQKMEEGRQKVFAQFPPEVQKILTGADRSMRMRPEKLKEIGYEVMLGPWKRLAGELARLYAYSANLPAGVLVVRHYTINEHGLASVEDEDDQDYWLNIAFAVAPQFELRPTLNSLTWIDGLDRKLRDIGNLDPAELKQLEPIATFVELFS